MAKSTVSSYGHSIDLTKNELLILYYLFLHKEEIVARAGFWKHSDKITIQAKQ